MGARTSEIWCGTDCWDDDHRVSLIMISGSESHYQDGLELELCCSSLKPQIGARILDPEQHDHGVSAETL